MKRPLLILSVSLVLSACVDQDLYGKLTERQANEMVAVLRSAGLAAEKVPQEGGSFVLRSSAADFARAVQLLHAGGYPHDGHESLGQVFKKEGFVSSPLEERARLTYALSQEIASTISAIDGVVMARVHVAVPERDPLAEAAKPASASVFVKHRSGLDLAPRVGEIKALVVNAIEGLPYEKVTVVLFPADPWPAVPAQGPAQAQAWHGVGGVPGWLGALGLAGAALALAGGAAWWWRRRSEPLPALPAPSGAQAWVTHQGGVRSAASASARTQA